MTESFSRITFLAAAFVIGLIASTQVDAQSGTRNALPAQGTNSRIAPSRSTAAGMFNSSGMQTHRRVIQSPPLQNYPSASSPTYYPNSNYRMPIRPYAPQAIYGNYGYPPSSCFPASSQPGSYSRPGNFSYQPQMYSRFPSRRYSNGCSGY